MFFIKTFSKYPIWKRIFITILLFELFIGLIIVVYQIWINANKENASLDSHILVSLTPESTKKDIFLLLLKTGLIVIPQNWQDLFEYPSTKFVQLKTTYQEESDEAKNLMSAANNEIKKLGLISGYHDRCGKYNSFKCIENYETYVTFHLEPPEEVLISKIQEIANKYHQDIEPIEVISRQYRFYAFPGTFKYYDNILQKEKSVKHSSIQTVGPGPSYQLTTPAPF